MIGQMSSASYDTEIGRVKVVLKTSTANGYGNTVEQYSPYGVISVPLPTDLINLDRQASSQVIATGYNNTVKDINLTVNAGEIGLYSTNWYIMTANAGIYMQVRNSANKENAVMGQSTNKVIVDMLDLLISIIDYLADHVHTGVTTGGGDSGPPLVAPPSDADVVADKTYIDGNKNLAITGTYEPK